MTEYASADLSRSGVRGVSGELGMQARVTAFGAIVVIEAWGTGSEVERRPLRPDLPTTDIVFVEEGEFEYLDGSTWRTSRGPLMVAPSGLPHRVRFLGPWRFIVARVPRQMLLAYVPMLADEVHVYDTLTVPERAMQAFLAQTARGEQPPTEGDSRSVDRFVLDMAGTLLLARGGNAVPVGTPRAVVRDRALAMIAERHADTSLSPEQVARGVDVSLRHLQTVFAEVGTSVAGEIRRERARVARSLLQDVRFDELSVDGVAKQAGFGSSASLRRTLDDLYGLSPRDLRATR